MNSGGGGCSSVCAFLFFAICCTIGQFFVLLFHKHCNIVTFCSFCWVNIYPFTIMCKKLAHFACNITIIFHCEISNRLHLWNLVSHVLFVTSTPTHSITNNNQSFFYKL